MALIKCPECGKDVSDKAKSCPNCGNPISNNGVVGLQFIKIVHIIFPILVLLGMLAIPILIDSTIKWSIILALTVIDILSYFLIVGIVKAIRGE